MPLFELKSAMPVAAHQVYAYHARPGAFERLVPPWERLSTEHAEGGIEDGAVRVLRMRHGPLNLRWVARHRDHHIGQSFCDVQETGPFRAWEHEHIFLPESGDTPGNSTLYDRIHWDLPLASLVKPLIESKLRRTFAFRHRRTQDDLLRQMPYSDRGSLKIVICGRLTRPARQLAAFLGTAGHRVYYLSYDPHQAGGRFVMRTYFDKLACHPLEGADALVYTGAPADPSASNEDPLTFWDFLHRALKTLGKPPALIHLDVAVPPLDSYTIDPALDPPSRLERLHLAEQTRDMLDSLEEWVPRRVNLHFGTLVGAPYVRMIRELLHLETFLFLEDGARTPHFAWISEDDALAAILHVIYNEGISGSFAVTHETRATRSEFQQLLLARHFAAYSWHRMLRVLPWARLGQPEGMRPELNQYTPIAKTGFKPLAHHLAEALDGSLGAL